MRIDVLIMEYCIDNVLNICFFFQLRYLQTLSSIAAEHNSTIIFPMPMNILDHFMGKKSKDKDLEALEDAF